MSPWNASMRAIANGAMPGEGMLRYREDGCYRYDEVDGGQLEEACGGLGADSIQVVGDIGRGSGRSNGQSSAVSGFWTFLCDPAMSPPRLEHAMSIAFWCASPALPATGLVAECGIWGSSMTRAIIMVPTSREIVIS
jgi:hypothetical protein